jgi:hypothetical protein
MMYACRFWWSLSTSTEADRLNEAHAPPRLRWELERVDASPTSIHLKRYFNVLYVSIPLLSLLFRSSEKKNQQHLTTQTQTKTTNEPQRNPRQHHGDNTDLFEPTPRTSHNQCCSHNYTPHIDSQRTIRGLIITRTMDIYPRSLRLASLHEHSKIKNWMGIRPFHFFRWK